MCQHQQTKKGQSRRKIGKAQIYNVMTVIHSTIFATTKARDYKDKHKLDSKLISDSAFGAHLSFSPK